MVRIFYESVAFSASLKTSFTFATKYIAPRKAESEFLVEITTFIVRLRLDCRERPQYCWQSPFISDATVWQDCLNTIS